MLDHDWDDEDDDWADGDGDGDETAPCPRCGVAIYDDAERCPVCEAYLSREDAPWRPPLWKLAGVGLCLAVVAYWVFRQH